MNLYAKKRYMDTKLFSGNDDIALWDANVKIKNVMSNFVV